MPAHAPVRVGSLVEQRGLHGNEIATDDGPEQLGQTFVGEQPHHGGMLDEVPDAGTAAADAGDRRRGLLTLALRQRQIGHLVTRFFEEDHSAS